MKCELDNLMKKRAKKFQKASGFTLPELLVAMTITMVLVTLTIVITASALDAWKGARAEIRAAGQAKIMLNALGKDLESMVSRFGSSETEWLVARTETADIGPQGQASPNAARLTFFTAAADRYDGNAGSQERITGGENQNADRGGDVCAVSYRLDFVEPIFGDPSERFATFVLYRNLLNPDDTYNGVAGAPNLESAFETRGAINQLADLICENVFEFTVTFVVDYLDPSGQRRTLSVPVMSTASGSEVVRNFSILGTGLAPNGNIKSPYSNGRVKSVELAITVLSDEGISVLKKNPFKNDLQRAKFIEENSYRYTKAVSIPQG